MEKIIQFKVYLILGYIILGIIFSFFFYAKGMKKVDKVSNGSTIGFKLIVFPGVVTFWPFLFSKWRKI